jgi:hypothetical protein
MKQSDKFVWVGIVLFWSMAMTFTGTIIYNTVHAQNVEAMQRNKAMILPAEGFVPDTVVIKRAMKDGALVCAEPASGGTVSCRPVGEFRQWVSLRVVRK